MPDSSSLHVPVLPAAILQWLAPQPGQFFVDGTLGGGGHTRLLAEQVGCGGLVLAVDRDAAAVAAAEQSLNGLPVNVAHASYTDLPEVLATLQAGPVDGILLDLGLSSDQLADTERGFSYDCAGPLDLRFDTTRGEPAWRLLERLDADRLADILYQYGEERCSRRIARRIVEQRSLRPIRTARELAELVRSCVPRSRNHRIDPATRSFQALRIEVNQELRQLEIALRRLPALLRPAGRLAIISFHSLEDRLVKHAFRSDPRLHVLTRKPVRPEIQETAHNPRSRSARLRVAERVAD